MPTRVFRTETNTPPAKGTEPSRGPAPMTIALLLVLGSIMVAIDITVVNIAINRLSQDFAVSLATVQWVATAYSLALGAVIPVTSWAADRFGATRLYLTAVALFGVGSLLAGTAWNIESLIVFRALQGLGGGMVTPVGMTILLRVAPKDQLGRLMSTLGMAIIVGPLIGPVLGGWLIDEVSWRWMFWINVPIGALVIALSARLFPRDERRPGRRLDLPALLLLSPGVVALLYGVTTGGDRGDFGTPGAWAPMVVGAALVAGFVVRTLTARHPLIDLGLFGNRSFTAATVTMTLFATGYFGSMLLMPLYLQVVRGESAMTAGLLTAPWALASGTAMQITGRIGDRIGPGRVVPFGAVLGVTGFTLLAVQLSADTSYRGLVAALVLIGLGGGSTLMPAMTAASQGVSSDRASAVSTTLNLISNTVAAISTAVTTVLLGMALADRVPAVEDGLQGLRTLDAAERTAVLPALADAFQQTFLPAIVMTGLAVIPAVLLARRTRSRRPDPAE